MIFDTKISLIVTFNLPFDPIYMKAIVLRMYMVALIDNFAINMVVSRQKLRFISKQNNFQTETVYTFTMTTAQVNDFKAGETRGKL